MIPALKQLDNLRFVYLFINRVEALNNKKRKVNIKVTRSYKFAGNLIRLFHVMEDIGHVIVFFHFIDHFHDLFHLFIGEF